MSDPAEQSPAAPRRRVRSVVVLDHGSGNVHSAVRALAHVGADVELTAEVSRAERADGVLLPGVGNFHACVAGMRAAQVPQIVARRLERDQSVLGICVGMQALFEASDESARFASEGLALWPGTVHRLDAAVVPHMGWSPVRAAVDSVLFAGIGDERFYFVHSYAATAWNASPRREVSGLSEGGRPESSPPGGEQGRVGVREGPQSATGDCERIPFQESGLPARAVAAQVTWAEHGQPFVAAVEDGPLSGTQFHPEKSGEAGLALLENWVRSI